MGRPVDFYGPEEGSGAAATSPPTIHRDEQLHAGQVLHGSDTASVVTQSSDDASDAVEFGRIDTWVALGGPSVLAHNWGRARALGDGAAGLLLVQGVDKGATFSKCWEQFMPDELPSCNCLIHNRPICDGCSDLPFGGLWIIGICRDSPAGGMATGAFRVETIFGGGIKLTCPR